MSPTQVPDWFIAPKPNLQAGLRLFCFPYAGGSAALYHTWSEHLPKTVEVCAAQLPGRGSRLCEPPIDRLEPLIEALGAAILPFLQKPFAFFGHSMGALIAFELSRFLRREKNLGPQHLFVSGRCAPQIPKTEPPIYDLPHDKFVMELQCLDGTPTEVLEHPELMDLVIPLLRADFAVADTYEYRIDLPLGCGITAYGGMQDNKVTRESLEAWRVHTQAGFQLRMLPGGHFFVQTEQSILLRSLYSELGQLMMRVAF